MAGVGRTAMAPLWGKSRTEGARERQPPPFRAALPIRNRTYGVWFSALLERLFRLTGGNASGTGGDCLKDGRPRRAARAVFSRHFHTGTCAAAGRAGDLLD